MMKKFDNEALHYLVHNIHMYLKLLNKATL